MTEEVHARGGGRAGCVRMQTDTRYTPKYERGGGADALVPLRSSAWYACMYVSRPLSAPPDEKTDALECPCFSLVPEADAKAYVCAFACSFLVEGSPTCLFGYCFASHSHYDCKFKVSDSKTLLQMWEVCAGTTTPTAAGLRVAWGVLGCSR